MDYKEKYEQALERARISRLQLLDIGEEATEIEHIFPELRESEDERIRKELLEHCINRRDGKQVCVDASDYRRWAAWLERQGGQKPAEWHSKDEQNLNACLGYITDEFLRRWLKDVIHVKYDKIADEVKPKFKIGDWVVQDNIGVFNIIEICKSWYEVIDIKDNHYSISFDNEHICHLWTIQDAKAGDVLFVKPTENLDKQLIIFGGINSDSRIEYYCRFLNNKFSINDGLMGYDHEYFLPATKEQRDTLFAKMKEAGYEWDAEKKELNKIEQKQNWSEEDEKMLEDTISCLSAYQSPDISKGLCYQEQIDWLKSLKPRWKPTEEQMQALKKRTHGLHTSSETRKTLESLIDDLKKL